MPKTRITATLGIALAIPLWVMAQEPADKAAAPVGGVAAPGMVAPEVAAPATEAEKAIDAAIVKLQALKSVSADLSVTADMLNQKIRLKGEYKKAPGNRVYMLLTLLGAGDSAERMLQVCDGVVFWEFMQVLNTQSCVKRTIEPIFKVLNGPDVDPKLREEVLNGIGFAGPDALLQGLRKSFQIDQMRDGELNGKPVLILGGSWKDAKTPVYPGGGGPGSLALPLYVPGLVTIYLGKDDGWPYQVLFEGRLPAQIEQKKKMEETQVDPTGRAIAKKLTAPSAKPSRVLLTYSNVKLNTPIPDDTFAFAPPQDARTRDETNQLVSQLEQILNAAAERKKAQAEKSGPVLEGAVPAPTPGSDAARSPVAPTPK